MRNTIIKFFEYKEKYYRPGQMNLFDFFTTDLFKQRVEELRACADEEQKTLLKNSLPCALPSLLAGDWKSEDHSGFICIDVDKKGNEHLTPAERKSIVCSSEYTLLCGYSCSGNGVWGLIRLADTTKHEQHFEALEIYFQGMGLKIDGGCGNVNRFRFASYDPDYYLNDGAEIFDLIPDEEPKVHINLTLPDYIPGEDIFSKFNREADIPTILTNNEWKLFKVKGNKTYLTRPGKAGETSGIVNGDKNLFYCFSNNAYPLIGDSKGAKAYNACGLLKVLECNNDNKILAEKIKQILNIK